MTVTHKQRTYMYQCCDELIIISMTVTHKQRMYMYQCCDELIIISMTVTHKQRMYMYQCCDELIIISTTVTHMQRTYVYQCYDSYYYIHEHHTVLVVICPCGNYNKDCNPPVVWGIRIQPTFALVRVVRGD